jgi:hypothetical protein
MRGEPVKGTEYHGSLSYQENEANEKAGQARFRSDHTAARALLGRCGG